MTSFPGSGYITGHPGAAAATATAVLHPSAERIPGGPQTTDCSAPGLAMRSAVILALLLCAGQGERARGPGEGSPGEGSPAARPKSLRAPRLQHRGQRRRLLPGLTPLCGLRPGPHRTLGPDPQPAGQGPPRPHPLSVPSAALGPAPAPRRAGQGQWGKVGGGACRRSPLPSHPLPSFHAPGFALTYTSPHCPLRPPQLFPSALWSSPPFLPLSPPQSHCILALFSLCPLSAHAPSSLGQG